MSSYALFGDPVHFPCSYLYLHSLPEGVDDCGVQRLIHIGLGQRDIILKTAWHRFPHGMDDTEDLIALLYGTHYDPEGQDIIDLVYIQILAHHLSIDTEKMLVSPLYRGIYVGLLQSLGQGLLDVPNEFFPCLSPLGNPLPNILIDLWLKIEEREILQSRLQPVDTHPSSKRCIDIEGLPRD